MINKNKASCPKLTLQQVWLQEAARAKASTDSEELKKLLRKLRKESE